MFAYRAIFHIFRLRKEAEDNLKEKDEIDKELERLSSKLVVRLFLFWPAKA